jgi:mannan endo-1,4-beta-mannosidase
MQKIWFKILIFSFCLGVSANLFAVDPANPNSNNDVKLILNYFASLKNKTDHRLVSGQFIGYSGGVNNYGVMTSIFNNTGEWVGITGSDYVDYSSGQKIKYNLTNPNLIKAWRAGSLVTLQVHMTNPANPNGAGLRDTGVDLNTLLVPGTDTYSRWFQEMDIIAAGLSQLQDSGVVVLFRPFHEMNGAWFWWGGKSPATFIEVWKQMFNYFTTTKKLNNLIWVFGPNMGSNAANYYPGDGFADITGLDAYTSNITISGISGYSAMVKLGKPFGFTEFGPENASSPSGLYDYRLFINGLKTNFPAACFFISWNDKWGLSSNKFVKEALTDNYVANRDDLNWSQPNGLIKINESPSFNFNAYPNPLVQGNSLKLEISDISEKEVIQISIYDLEGKEISRQKLHNSSDGIFELKNTQSLLKGFYLIKIKSKKKSGSFKLEIK